MHKQWNFCITECSGKILVVDHEKLNYESGTTAYTLDVLLIQNQYHGGVVVPTIIDNSGRVVINVVDVNEPPSLHANVEFSSHEDTPTSLAPYEIHYDDVDGKSDVVGIELVKPTRCRPMFTRGAVARAYIHGKLYMVLMGLCGS